MWLAKNRLQLVVQLVKFSMVGIVNTIFGVSIILLMKYIGFDDLTASFSGYFAGYILSFFLNKKLTFTSNSHSKKLFFKYTITYVIVYIITFVWVSFLSHLFQTQYLHHIAGVPLFFILNFLGCKYWVFKA